MRYPPLMIAMFLWMIVRAFYGHLGSSHLPTSVFMLLLFLTLIYAFRHSRHLAAFLAIMAVAAASLRVVADLWQLPGVDLLLLGPSLIALVVVIIAILSEVLRTRVHHLIWWWGRSAYTSLWAPLGGFFTTLSTCSRLDRFSFRQSWHP